MAMANMSADNIVYLLFGVAAILLSINQSQFPMTLMLICEAKSYMKCHIILIFLVGQILHLLRNGTYVFLPYKWSKGLHQWQYINIGHNFLYILCLFDTEYLRWFMPMKYC